jgi:hypothetical protein
MLHAVGDRLALDGTSASIVVLGGAAMNLHGYVERPTRDVDVLARADDDGSRLRHPEPLPDALRQAIAEVALDFNQPANWMNTAVAHQWKTGLPPGLEDRLTWHGYGALRVGLVGRKDLIAFKLYASADQVGPGSVHVSDLVALKPSSEELRTAAAWVHTQDTSTDFHAIVDKVIDYVEHHVA